MWPLAFHFKVKDNQIIPYSIDTRYTEDHPNGKTYLIMYDPIDYKIDENGKYIFYITDKKLILTFKKFNQSINVEWTYIHGEKEMTYHVTYLRSWFNNRIPEYKK